MKNATSKRSSINTKSELNLNPEFTEFSYLSGYNLRISCHNNLAIIAYNLETLDGERYEIQMNQLFLFKLSEKFKKLNAINNIYSYIIKLIKENHFRLISNPPYLSLILQIKDNIDYIQEIKINLMSNNKKSGYSKHAQEYLEILINEIKRLRNSGKIEEEIKNENINLKKQIKEFKNIIQSYNSNNEIKLKNKNDKKDIISLDDFNKKFGLKISNNQIKRLNLDGLHLGNNIMDFLLKIEFNSLEKL